MRRAACTITACLALCGCGEEIHGRESDSGATLPLAGRTASGAGYTLSQQRRGEELCVALRVTRADESGEAAKVCVDPKNSGQALTGKFLLDCPDEYYAFGVMSPGKRLAVLRGGKPTEVATFPLHGSELRAVWLAASARHLGPLAFLDKNGKVDSEAPTAKESVSEFCRGNGAAIGTLLSPG
jgi:hypothetical protein